MVRHFSPMSTKSTPPKEPEHTFESAVERLEGIVDAMESDKMPLEELLVRYEEGVKLVKTCQEKLESAEKRIEIITRNAAGKPQTAPFDPAAAPPAPPKAAAKKPEDSDEVSLF
jgi:exodeoxyribonuclease VII small subunit